MEVAGKVAISPRGQRLLHCRRECDGFAAVFGISARIDLTECAGPVIDYVFHHSTVIEIS